MEKNTIFSLSSKYLEFVNLNKLNVCIFFILIGGCSQKYALNLTDDGVIIDVVGGTENQCSIQGTNTQKVTVKFSDIRNYQFTEMQIAEESQFSETNTPKIPFATTTEVDLGTQFNSDHSLDGVKNIKIVLYQGPVSITRIKPIFLDTVAPVASGLGIFKNGLEPGKNPTAGENLPLSWTAQDPAATATNASKSGLANYSVGWSRNADCSLENINLISRNFPYDGKTNPFTYTGFNWPQGVGPIDAIYVCAVFTDCAGNATSLLSQPLTNLWRVLAGDNNQGNGGTLNEGGKVRFSYPDHMTTDSNGNVFVLDNYFHSIRKIEPANNNISLFAGNGKASFLTTDSDDAVNGIIPQSTSMSRDKQNRIYLGTYHGIARIIPGTPKNKIEQWIKLPSSYSLVAVDPRSNTVFIHHRQDWQNPNIDTHDNWIFKFNILANGNIDNGTATGIEGKDIDLAFLKAGFVFAGNGKGALHSENFSEPSRSATLSVDYPIAITVGEPGELFLTTYYWPESGDIGHHQIRVLKKDPSNPTGPIKNYLIADAGVTAGGFGLHYVHRRDPATGILHRYLLKGNEKSLFKLEGWPISASPPTIPAPVVITPVEPLGTVDRFGSYGMTAQVSASGFLIYVGNATKSRIVVLKPDLTLHAKYGRDTYDATEPVATKTVISTPGWLAETPNESLYFFEYLSHIIRKVDKSGIISLVAGHPNDIGSDADRVAQRTGEIPFADFYFNGVPSNVNYIFPMVYHRVSNSLFFGDLGGKKKIFRKLNLTNSKVTSFVSTTPGLKPTGVPETVDEWESTSIAIDPTQAAFNTAGPINLTVARASRYIPQPAQIAILSELNGSTTEAITGWDPACTSDCPEGREAFPTPGPADKSGLMRSTAALYDSKGNYYFTQLGRVYRINTSGTLSLLKGGSSLYTLALFEEADGSIHFFGTDREGLSINHFSISSANAVVSSTQAQTPPNQLCLPGTFLNYSRHLLALKDRSLAISDTRSSRILKYYVHDDAGNIKVFLKSDPACPKD